MRIFFIIRSFLTPFRLPHWTLWTGSPLLLFCRLAALPQWSVPRPKLHRFLTVFNCRFCSGPPSRCPWHLYIGQCANTCVGTIFGLSERSSWRIATWRAWRRSSPKNIKLWAIFSTKVCACERKRRGERHEGADDNFNSRVLFISDVVCWHCISSYLFSSFLASFLVIFCALSFISMPAFFLSQSGIQSTTLCLRPTRQTNGSRRGSKQATRLEFVWKLCQKSECWWILPQNVPTVPQFFLKCCSIGTFAGWFWHCRRDGKFDKIFRGWFRLTCPKVHSRTKMNLNTTSSWRTSDLAGWDHHGRSRGGRTRAGRRAHPGEASGGQFRVFTQTVCVGGFVHVHPSLDWTKHRDAQDWCEHPPPSGSVRWKFLCSQTSLWMILDVLGERGCVACPQRCLCCWCAPSLQMAESGHELFFLVSRFFERTIRVFCGTSNSIY